MNIKRSVTFELTKQKKDGVLVVKNVPIRMVVTYSNKSEKGSSQRIIFYSGYRIDMSKWDIEEKRVQKGCTNKQKQTASEINADLSKYEGILHDIFKTFEVNEIYPSPEQVKHTFSERLGKNDTHSIDSQEITCNKKLLLAYFDEFVQSSGKQNNWTDATYVKVDVLKKHLINFDPYLDLSLISETDLQNFVQHFLDSGMRNITVSNYISIVRWFLRWAYKKGYYSGILHESFRPKFKGTDGNSKEVIHLNWDELIRLLNYSLPESKKHLDKLRDVFCFTCFTGLRHSDVYKLRRSDVKPGYIDVVTHKTYDGLKIELNKYSQAILDKYATVNLKDDKALPVTSTSCMNRQLKELGEIVAINEPQRVVYFKGNKRIEEVHPKYELLSTHCGRRTFIVNALYLGISSEVIMKWTGHSDFKAMKPYVKIVDELKASEMNKFNQR